MSTGSFPLVEVTSQPSTWSWMVVVGLLTVVSLAIVRASTPFPAGSEAPARPSPGSDSYRPHSNSSGIDGRSKSSSGLGLYEPLMAGDGGGGGGRGGGGGGGGGGSGGNDGLANFGESYGLFDQAAEGPVPRSLEQRASLVSKWLFWWVYGLLRTGFVTGELNQVSHGQIMHGPSRLPCVVHHDSHAWSITTL